MARCLLLPGTYDCVLCCVGVQYLEEPEQVFAEVARILKPTTGVCIVSFANRFFYQKALVGWMERGMRERARLVKDYMRAAGGFREGEGELEVRGEGIGAIAQLLSWVLVEIPLWLSLPGGMNLLHRQHSSAQLRSYSLVPTAVSWNPKRQRRLKVIPKRSMLFCDLRQSMGYPDTLGITSSNRRAPK